jgi:hypothetical protein
MQVFVLTESHHIAYEGTWTVVQGVYLTRDEAFAKVKERLPKEADHGQEKFMIVRSRSADEQWFRLREMTVGEYQGRDVLFYED